MGTEAEREAQFQQALETFDPERLYHWRCWPLTNRAGFVPMIVPHPWGSYPAWSYDLATLQGYVRAMDQMGVDVRRGVWMIGNEPEYGPWSPERVVQAMVDQIEIMHEAGIYPSQIVAPGCNIKPRELDYLRRWYDAAKQAGLQFVLAIHLYDWRTWRLDQIWSEFCQWFDGTGERELIVTEAGGGPNRTLDECMAVMPWFYQLLDDPRVRALYASGVYPIAWGADVWQGMMSMDGVVNGLGRQWMAERDRRSPVKRH